MRSKTRPEAVLLLVFIGLLLCVSQPTLAVYFNVVEGQKRCFIEEVGEDVLVVGSYTNLDMTRMESQAAIRLTVQDPKSAVILQSDLSGSGRFAFSSQVAGEHNLCLQTNTSQSYPAYRFQLQLSIGESATDYSEVAKQEHLSAIEVEVRKLNDKLKQIRAEQEYQKKREEYFRDISESTNSRVMWWSVAEVLVLLLLVIYQLVNLQSFFKSKLHNK